MKLKIPLRKKFTSAFYPLLGITILLTGIVSLQPSCAQEENPKTKKEIKPVMFKMQMVASESYETVGVYDVNKDGKPDIVSGAFWYEAPEFQNRHYIGHVNRFGNGEYYDDLAHIPIDANGDGNMDFATGGWNNQQMLWMENPGNNQEWKQHIIDQTGNVETARGWDVDNDGQIEIVPNNPGHPLKFYKLEKDAAGKATGKFTKIPVADKHGHGLGFGDVNGDKRGDFIISNGWVEAPQDPLKGKWIIHNEFELGTASVPILVVDVNGDGKNDLIVGQGHDYGLDWYEQKTDASGKKRTWAKHPIDPFVAQYHTMEWVDLDGDGKEELVTGKRYRAHNGRDPGEKDPLGIFYFKWNGESFTKHVISYGPYGQGKGTGVIFAIADLRGTGRKDIIVAGKDGLAIFYNEGTDY
jgi:hypothetical protein